MFRGNGDQSFWGDGTFLLSGIRTTYPLGIGNLGYEVQPFNDKAMIYLFMKLLLCLMINCVNICGVSSAKYWSLKASCLPNTGGQSPVPTNKL